MYYLVGYFTHPSGARLRALHRSFGEEFPLSVLLVVSRAFESFGDAISSKEELQNARILTPHEGVLVQPDEEQIPALWEETAVHLLNRHEAWNEFVRGVAVKEHEIVVKTKEHSRC